MGCVYIIFNNPSPKKSLKVRSQHEGWVHEVQNSHKLCTGEKSATIREAQSRLELNIASTYSTFVYTPTGHERLAYGTGGGLIVTGIGVLLVTLETIIPQIRPKLELLPSDEHSPGKDVCWLSVFNLPLTSTCMHL